MVFSPDALPVDDFHGVDLVGIVLEIAKVHRAVLTFSQHFRCQNNLNFVSWEGNNLASRL